MAKVKIYDTTLRDGMQAEGVSFSLEDKVLIAKKLDEFGVDYIEGGYPQSNPKEQEFFERLKAMTFKNAKVVAFGSTRRANTKVEDDLCLKVLLDSQAPAITIVGKSWDMQVTEVLGCSLEENLAMCSESVIYLKKHDKEVIFDAEHFFDGYKANAEYSLKVLKTVADAWVDSIVLCETNGGALPHEVFEITQAVCKAIPNVEIGIHCHNDTDCAVANSLASIQAGSRQVQGTINGIGERCGNANLCTIIPNLELKMGYETVGSAKVAKITELSRFVFEIANMQPATHMAYVGESAFAHKAGLHINALRKNKKTYEHIDPSTVGNERRILISELAGASTMIDKLEKRNITDKTIARKILERIQNLENQGYQFETAEASFDILVKKETGAYKPFFDLAKYHVNIEHIPTAGMLTEATVKLRVDGVTEHVVSEGDGPVNALDGALRKALSQFYPNICEMSLIDYKVRVVNAGAGTAAKVRVAIESRDHDSMWGTIGVSENIIEASWLALVDSVEYKLLKDKEKQA